MLNKQTVAGLLAAGALAAATTGSSMPRMFRRASAPKRYPTMLVSSPEVIAENNRNVKTRQVLRRMSRPWKAAARWDASGF